MQPARGVLKLGYPSTVLLPSAHECKHERWQVAFGRRRGAVRLPHKRLITKILQRYWRLSRGLSLEVRACAQDASGRVLLVRHSDDEPWRLPGGRVLRGETAAAAVRRWLALDGLIEPAGHPRLISLYAGDPPQRSDQIALYLVASWRDIGGGGEAAKRAFFGPGGLPHPIDPATAEWLSTVNEARAQLQVW